MHWLPRFHLKWATGLPAKSISFCILVSFVVAGAVVLHLDFFGLSRMSENFSQDLLAFSMSRCYPDATTTRQACIRSDAEGKRRRANVSVVLLQDADLQQDQVDWPAHYGFHARILRAIRVNGPRAVLIDIVFTDERDDDTITELVDELRRYRDAGIRVYAATFAAQEASSGLAKLRPELLGLVVPVQVPKLVDPLDHVTRHYELRTTTGHPTAAALLFQEQCNAGIDGDESMMRLYWPPPERNRWNSHWLLCRPRSGLFERAFHTGEDPFRDDCPATPTVPVRILLGPSRAQERNVRRLMDDAIVLYGAHFQGASDIVNTPVSDDLPGVFLHAVALDNLITLDEPLPAGDAHLPLLDVSAGDLVMLILAGILFVTNRKAERKPEHHTGSDSFATKLGQLVHIVGPIPTFLLVTFFALAFAPCSLTSLALTAGVNPVFGVSWLGILEAAAIVREVMELFGTWIPERWYKNDGEKPSQGE